MSQQKTYNGWPNYETWNVMLWMDNLQGYPAEILPAPAVHVAAAAAGGVS